MRRPVSTKGAEEGARKFVKEVMSEETDKTRFESFVKNGLLTLNLIVTIPGHVEALLVPQLLGQVGHAAQDGPLAGSGRESLGPDVVPGTFQ